MVQFPEHFYIIRHINYDEIELKLSDYFIKNLLKLPESGMGYQIVRVFFKFRKSPASPQSNPSRLLFKKGTYGKNTAVKTNILFIF